MASNDNDSEVLRMIHELTHAAGMEVSFAADDFPGNEDSTRVRVRKLIPSATLPTWATVQRFAVGLGGLVRELGSMRIQLNLLLENHAKQTDDEEDVE